MLKDKQLKGRPLDNRQRRTSQTITIREWQLWDWAREHANKTGQGLSRIVELALHEYRTIHVGDLEEKPYDGI